MLKHNKRKNSKIIYEQLMNLATRLVFEKKIEEYKLVCEVIKKYFSNSLLEKEKNIFDSIFKTSNISLNEGIEILSECINEYKFIDSIKLNEEKDNLIKEINEKIGKDLFKIPIKNYKLLASIYVYLNENKYEYKHSTPKERVKIKNMLLEHMNKQIDLEENVIYDNMTYKILIEKFNKTYYSLINKDQKDILSNYINYLITENDSFKKLLLNKKTKIINEINNEINAGNLEEEVIRDIMIAKNNLKKESFDIINEENIYQIMKYFDLLDDLKESKYEQENIKNF